MDAVLSIDHALRLEPYAGVEEPGHMLHLVDPARSTSRIRPLLADPPTLNPPS